MTTARRGHRRADGHMSAASAPEDSAPLPAAIHALESIANNAANLELLVAQIQSPIGVVPFVGAGLSVPFGFPAWRAFLESMASEATVLQETVARLDAGLYEEAAEALSSRLGEDSFQAAVERTFGCERLPEPWPAAAVLHLPRLCAGPVLSTNLDSVLEAAFERARRPFEDCLQPANIDALREAFHGGRRVLLKLHGDARNRSSRVLTRTDYERVYGDREPLPAILEFAATRPLLFLGCSLAQDRTVRVLESFTRELSGRRATRLQMHYAFVESPSDPIEFSNRQARLEALGIRCVWYPPGQHDFVTALLSYLATRAGRLPVYGLVPAEPAHYLVRRQELTALRSALLDRGAGTIAVVGSGHAVGVQGMGGVGKTVLAAALTRDPEIHREYPDGVYWLTVGINADTLGLLNQLATFLPNSRAPFALLADAQRDLREKLAGKHALLILDDVWDVNDAAALNVLSRSGRLLVTTRKHEVVGGLQAAPFAVDVLALDDALRLLSRWVGLPDAAALPDLAESVARKCGCLPLALATIGAMIRLRPSAWADVLDLLRGHDLDEFRTAFPDYPYPHLLRAIAIGVQELPRADRLRYLQLAVFSEDSAVPEGALQVMWGLSASKTRACVDRLVARSMAFRQDDAGTTAIVLHDLQAAYVRRQMEAQLPALHARLLNGYGAKCSSGWPSGPNDGYFLQQLHRHLIAAGKCREACDLVLDLRWLEAKHQADQIFELLRDFPEIYRHTPANEPRRHLLPLIEEALRREIHFIAEHFDNYPQALFQCLWNLCWWYDCEGVEQYYRTNENQVPALPPSAHGAPRLSTLTTLWLTQKSTDTPGFVWVRSLRPPQVRLGGVYPQTLRGRVNSLAFSPSNSVLAGVVFKVLHVWDAGTGVELTEIPLDVSANCLLFTPRDESVFVGFWDGTVRRMPVSENGAEPSTAIRAGKGVVGDLSCSADGTLMAVGQATRVSVFDLTAPGAPPIFRKRLRRFGPMRVALSPDGRRLASMSHWSVAMWDVATRRRLWATSGIRAGCPMSFSPDGRRLAVGSHKNVEIVDASTGDLLVELAGHTDGVRAVAYSPGGEWLATGSADRTIRLWDARDGSPLHCLRAHADQVVDVAFSRDGGMLASCAERSVLVWDPRRDYGESWIRFGDEDEIRGVAFSPRGDHAVTGTLGYGRLRVWDARTGAVVRDQFEDHFGGSHRVAFHPGGTVVAASRDGGMAVWDTSTGSAIWTQNYRDASVQSLAYNHDGTRIAAVLWFHEEEPSGRGELVIWNALDGAVVMRFPLLEGDNEDSSVTWTANGAHLVQGAPGQVTIWDANIGIPQWSFPIAPSQSDVAVSPDGRIIVTGGDLADSVSRYSFKNGKQVSDFSTPDADLKAIARGDPYLPSGWGTEVAVLDMFHGGSVAFVSARLERMTTHPDGRTWAGTVGKSLEIMRLEGHLGERRP